MWFGERIRPSELFRPAQNVLQRRRCFSEPLVARRRSVDKRLGVRSRRLGANAWAEKKKVPGLKNPGGYAAMVVCLLVTVSLSLLYFDFLKS